MIELKLSNAQNNWLEATWTEVVQLPDVHHPAQPTLFDADGNEVQSAVPEQVTPGEVRRTEMKYTCYHPTQLDLLQADAAAMGTPLDVHADMLVKWVADYIPQEPPVLTPAQQREQAKAARQAAVDAIKVTTAAGNTFDGDEISQTRMARAITVLSTGYATTVPWVLANNTVIHADIAELTEALAKAGAAQAALWII